jgi:hypothetical protein
VVVVFMGKLSTRAVSKSKLKHNNKKVERGTAILERNFKLICIAFLLGCDYPNVSIVTDSN